MSPEQAEGSTDIDTLSDVYVLGVILYELLAGRPPFDAQTLISASRKEMRMIIRETEPKPPSSAKSSLRPLGRQGSSERESTALPGRAKARELLSRDLDLITLRALAKDRTRRHESVTALAEDVQRFLNHEPVTARAPSLAYLTQRWIRRHRSLSVAAAALVLGAALALWQARVSLPHQLKRGRNEPRPYLPLDGHNAVQASGPVVMTSWRQFQRKTPISFAYSFLIASPTLTSLHFFP